MSSQRSRKVRMGSSRRHLARNALLADDVVPETQTDPDSTDSVNLDYSEHGNRLDLKEPISEILHETSEDIANASEKCGSLIRPPSALEIGVRSNRSPGVSQQPPEPQKEDMPGNNRTENLGMSESNELIEEQCREFSENKAVSQMGMLPDESCQKTTPQRSTPANDNRTPEVSQCSGDDWHPRHNSSLYSSPAQPFADDMSNCPKQLSDSIIHKGEHEIDLRKENTNSLAVSFSPRTIAETQEYLFQIEGICGDVQSSVKKEHEVKDYVNPLLTQFEHPIQSVVCPLLIEVPNQEEAEQEQITNTTPESHDTTGNYGVVVESQHLTIQDTFNPGNNQEMTVQDDLENTKRDHIFDLSDLEHNMKENTCSQVCESEGQASNKPWEFIEDSAQEEGEGHSLNIGPLQSECSSASADDENDHTRLTRGGNISFNDGTVENLTKQPVTDAEFMEPEKNQSASEKTVNLDSTIEFKDGCNNDCNITTSTEFNPQSEDVVPTSSNVTLSDSHSVDVLLVESCPSTNMADVNPLATVPQHCTSSGEDQCKSKEMYAPTSSQLRDGSAQVGAQTSTGLSHSLGITEIDLNKSYLENKNKNPVEMPEVETDFPQNSEGAATDCSRLDKDVKLTELASNQEQDGDLDIKSSRKKRKNGSSRRIGNKGIRGGVDHSGEIVESDFSTDPNKTNKSFEAELKVEMKCNSELPEGGMLGTFTDKADCLFLIPPQSEEIKERGSEDIIDKARKEEYTGANIHLPPEGSHGDVDDRKEDEAEEKSEIVEKMEVTKMPLFKTMSERNIQEISEEMSRQHHEEEVCRASTGPQEKDIRPPGADFPMLAQSSLSKENTPHSEDMNSSILFAPVSGIRDTDGKMDTAGQHPTAHSSNLDQISGQGNQRSLPNVKDDDNQVLRRRKMGSSRWTKGTATGSQKGSKEAQTTADQEIEKHAVISENNSEEDLPEQIFKDNEGAEKVVTEDKEPSPIGGDAHQSMSETNISATQTIVRRMLASSNRTVRMTPIQENIQEKKKVDSESSVSEDRKMFKDELKMKVNKDNETEQNGERSSETGVKRVNTTLSGLPSELSNDLHVEGRRRKLGSQRKSRGQQHHDYPPESEDQRALNFGDHPPTPPSLSRQITGNATRTFDPSSKCDLRADCFNVVMVGSSNVGKTSFMKRVQSGSFSPHFSASIGIDTCIHALPVDGSEVRLQLWDTAGQERFRSISKQVFHKGQAFLLMYDITSSKSFSDVRYWIGCIQESAGKDVIILLLGNKSDCAGRQVNPSEGQRLAKEYNIDFNECSAATGEHIISSIESLARKLTENDHTIEEGLVLQKQTKNRRCC